MGDLLPLFPVHRHHLDVLSTEVGVMQHARGSQPDPDHGYCTDDVARALTVDLLHGRTLGWDAVRASVVRNLGFLAEAFEGSSGWFRNLRRMDGSWLDIPGSEDANARALQALAEVILSAPSGGLREDATALFVRALPTASQVGSIRPQATVLLACDTAVGAGMDGEVLDVYRRVGDELQASFEACEADAEWPWPEALVTYENELPAMALIVGGRGLDRPWMTQTGLRVLDWLIGAQTAEDGHLRSIGNAGWWPRGGRKARFDQQAIAATSLLLAAAAAYEATGSPRYGHAVEMAYGWFAGRNDARAWVANPQTGACHDGIGAHGVSLNQGAESTLMWLIALERMRAWRESPPAPSHPGRRALVPVA